MQRFRRGDEIWARKDDGSWALWDRTRLIWVPAEPPPPDQLEPFEVPDMSGLLPSTKRPLGGALATMQRSQKRVRTIGIAVAAFVMLGMIIAVLWAMNSARG